MARRFQLSAIQYVGLALLGSLLIASVFILPQPFGRWFNAMSGMGRLLVFLFFFAAGTTLMLMAESRFRDGVQNGIWSEEEIAPLRAIFTSRWWIAFFVVVLIAVAISMFAFEHHYRGLSWALFTVTQSLSRLQMAFRKPTTKNPNGPDWSGMLPISSEHWGER